MNRWKAMIALLLAMLYLPATGHCQLEKAGWLPAVGDCCGQSAADGGTGSACDYGCCAMEHAVYFSPAAGGESRLIAKVSPCCMAWDPNLPPTRHQKMVPVSSPPELPKVWQFTRRTALPPRAPSLVS